MDSYCIRVATTANTKVLSPSATCAVEDDAPLEMETLGVVSQPVKSELGYIAWYAVNSASYESEI